MCVWCRVCDRAAQLALLPGFGTVVRVRGAGDDGPDGAPWLLEPSVWSIREILASDVRPGMFCFVPSQQEFVEVASCTLMRAQTHVVFIDLANGKTLQFPTTDEVFVRIKGAQ